MMDCAILLLLLLLHCYMYRNINNSMTMMDYALLLFFIINTLFLHYKIINNRPTMMGYADLF